MDKALLKKYLKLIHSETDSDAVMGLRGAQNLFKSAGVSVEDALQYAVDHLDQWRPAKKEKAPESKFVKKTATGEVTAKSPVVALAGVPECRVVSPGVIEVIPAGKASGETCKLPGEAAIDAKLIAAHLKDAIVAALVNKSHFKLKLFDIKNAKEEIVETVLQAEYDRDGMTPIRIWKHNRGELGALATVLRRLITKSFPDIV